MRPSMNPTTTWISLSDQKGSIARPRTNRSRAVIRAYPPRQAPTIVFWYP